MEYFAFLIFVCLISGISWGTFVYLQKIESSRYLIEFVSFLMSERHTKNHDDFFVYAEIQKIIEFVLQKKQKKILLDFFQNRDLFLLHAFLKKHKKFLWAVLILFFINEEKAVHELEEFIQKNPNNQKGLAFLSVFYFSENRNEEALKYLNLIHEKKSSPYLKALKNYYLAQLALKDAEMLEASEYASLAIRGFEKSRAPYEEARALLLLGTIYRISTLDDVSYFMFDSALKFYTKIKYFYGQAEALTNLAMLQVRGEKFSEAQSFLSQGLCIASEHNLTKIKAEILNQQALLSLLSKNLVQAKHALFRALRIHHRIHNSLGEAFSFDLLSYVYLEEKNYNALLKAAKKSLAYERKKTDPTAYLDASYLLATAYFELEDETQSEKILRQMILFSKQNKSNFHIANAYTLLGLIYLKQKDLKRARGLFFESLQLEQKNERFNALVADFANIALIDSKVGHVDEARKNLQLALAYAQKFSDQEIIHLIQSKIDALKS